MSNSDKTIRIPDGAMLEIAIAAAKKHGCELQPFARVCDTCDKIITGNYIGKLCGHCHFSYDICAHCLMHMDLSKYNINMCPKSYGCQSGAIKAGVVKRHSWPTERL